ncbi:MAG: L-lactate dehydrogenase [Candidatus Omnitrophica bacterium]|nr:L-lactate dehydrogenase [Candidatus Omnitrophota bacterium]MCF7878232.1 L-lactate dehydrogenase [Candidatus Omnitrophota bacterium]
MKNKISIVGAGAVGSTFAFRLMLSGLVKEIVLVDRDLKKAEGQVMDLNHGLMFASPANIYASDFSGIKNSNIVVVTAGAKQEPGQSRLDLVQKNTDIFKNILPQIAKHAPDAIILIVTNPVDILTYVALKILKYPKEKIFGSGTVLDTSRFRYLISAHCGVDPRNVHAYIIGEHGDTELPVWSNANIGGMLIEDYCPICKKGCNYRDVLGKIFDKVKKSAYEIIDKKGATYYAIALALEKIVDTVIRNNNSVLPVSTLIKDYYQINDVCLGVPAMVNNKGIDRILKIKLSQEEEKNLSHSADTLKDVIKKIKI